MSWTSILERIQDAGLRVTGLPAVYTQASTGNTYPLMAVFSGESIIVNAGPSGSDIETHAPSADIKLSDLPVLPKHLDTFSINGIGYRVIAIQPDGQGMTSLGLELM